MENVSNSCLWSYLKGYLNFWNELCFWRKKEILRLSSRQKKRFGVSLLQFTFMESLQKLPSCIFYFFGIASELCQTYVIGSDFSWCAHSFSWWPLCHLKPLLSTWSSLIPLSGNGQCRKGRGSRFVQCHLRNKWIHSGSCFVQCHLRNKRNHSDQSLQKNVFWQVDVFSS